MPAGNSFFIKAIYKQTTVNKPLLNLIPRKNHRCTTGVPNNALIISSAQKKLSGPSRRRPGRATSFYVMRRIAARWVPASMGLTAMPHMRPERPVGREA